ncbi:uncharacterized protein LOC110018557 [Phalaenopsis equestris]|uniref:uncharacterized protein LOC110018557 n=1 Tax=Phalaenopsis equestris TaxID=78828 RepID=UPI0009E3E615|nr:uncharacterized protein LOC110018557 [Phalaenopsis equestris]XP_020571566.1 uncharacterized protein LOC110018557 [Phalaenopsis equestris]
MESCKPLSQTLSSLTAMDATNPLRNKPLFTTSEKPSSIPEPITEGFIGSLEILVHQARDIHNICIYQNQDVYAKLCLTSDPEASISTKTINGGGRYPIFNESLKLGVRTIDSSLKCEIWMLSRVKNYLEDQLLGFALVPLSQIVLNNGKLEMEFSLSSTDLFHSPAGFVSLTISYTGSTPELMAIASNAEEAAPGDAANDNSISSEYEKMEFPDLAVVSENKMMISEYFGIPCTNSEPQNGECHVDCSDNDAEDRNVDFFSTENSHITIGDENNSSPICSGSADVPAAALDPSAITDPPIQKSNNAEVTDSDTSSSAEAPDKAFVLPLININLEPEQPVVQQEIVDMYMKSMQQFTEALAKMKLPMDLEKSRNGSSDGDGDDANSDKKMQASEKTSTPRVFYGSRAFF